MIGPPVCVHNVQGRIHNERGNVYDDKTAGAVGEKPVLDRVQSVRSYLSFLSFL